MNYKAKALSRIEIRNIALLFRKKLKLENELNIPVLHVFEMLANYGLFNIEILPKSTMKNKCGEAFPTEKLICIREDIYLKASEGDGFSRTTIVHEICHLLIHSERALSLCRTETELKNIKIYENPEWQANCFAGEFLVPKHLVEGLSVRDVVKKCNVSYEMAKYQLKIYKEESKVKKYT